MARATVAPRILGEATTVVNQGDLVTRYRGVFADATAVVQARSPGRINLIGEHVDYNDGFVLPIAMAQALYVLAGPSEDGQIAVHSTAFDQTVSFSADDPGPAGAPAWANYVRGVAALLVKQGIRLTGGRLFIHSEVPVGGGVSSSAALEVGTALALLALAGARMEPVSLALLARQAEHEYANSPCGIMDQFICVLGRAEHALLLDCRSREYQQIPLPLHDTAIVVMNTQVKHSIGASQYPVRQRQCREGLASLQSAYPQLGSLRDATEAMLEAQRDRLGAVVFRRCRHVVTEIARTRQAADVLRRGDLQTLGRLMYASHASLRDDYAVSCPELDHLVATAQSVDGVWGARMTGGGFGGCAIALVQRQAVDALRNAIAREYDTRFEKPAMVYTTSATDGASTQTI